jgi:hypothetical protein
MRVLQIEVFRRVLSTRVLQSCTSYISYGMYILKYTQLLHVISQSEKCAQVFANSAESPPRTHRPAQPNHTRECCTIKYQGGSMIEFSGILNLNCAIRASDQTGNQGGCCQCCLEYGNPSGNVSLKQLLQLRYLYDQSRDSS